MPDLDVGRPNPPEGFYRNNFHTKAVVAALRAFAPTVHRPVIYYPGSSTDVSLADIPRSSVIHVDQSFTAEQVRTMDSLKLRAVAADAHAWTPGPQDLSGAAVDVVALFNPTGLDVRQVLDRAPTRDGSLVAYVSWDGVPPQLEPAALAANFPELRFAGAFRSEGDDERVVMDHSTYAELYAPRRWESLSTEDRAYLDRRIEEIAPYLSLPDEMHPDERAQTVYEAVCTEPDGDLSVDMSYRLPRVGDGALLVYRVFGVGDRGGVVIDQ